MLYYRKFPELKLSNEVHEELLSLKFDIENNSMENLGYYDVTKEKIKDIVVKSPTKRLDEDKYHEYYGNDLANIGTMRQFDVPAKLADEILHQLNDIAKLTEERPYVRIQYMFGGQCVPIHYDVTRSTSFMYPLARHENTFTNFFEYLDDIEFVKKFYSEFRTAQDPEFNLIEDIVRFPQDLKNKFLENDYISGLIYGSINRERKNTIPNPLNSTMVGSVEINECPVLLNTDKLHDVRWTPNSLTVEHPRVSVFLKWNTLKFDYVTKNI